MVCYKRSKRDFESNINNSKNRYQLQKEYSDDWRSSSGKPRNCVRGENS